MRPPRRVVKEDAEELEEEGYGLESMSLDELKEAQLRVLQRLQLVHYHF